MLFIFSMLAVCLTAYAAKTDGTRGARWEVLNA